ncbi:eukaryotic translation initiation factor 4E-2 [Apiospora arundinis]
MALHNPNNWHWVDKDVIEWARDWFNKNLVDVAAEQGDVNVKISKVVSADGDVNVSQRKGKVITYYDVKLVLEFSGNAPGVEGVSGSFTVPEVTHDDEQIVIEDLTIHSESAEKQPVRDLIRSQLKPQLVEQLKKLTPALIAEHGKDIQHAPGSNPSSGFSTPKQHVPSGAKAANAGASAAAQDNKGGVVNTTTLVESEEFKTTAEQLYQTFTDPQRLAAFTRAPPKKFEGAKKGGKFELFDGNVSGEFLELAPTKIVQTWRLNQWPAGHFSKQTLEFEQNDADGVTNMRVTWAGVPVGQEDVTKRNWGEYYVRSIKQTFGFGTVL